MTRPADSAVKHRRDVLVEGVTELPWLRFDELAAALGALLRSRRIWKRRAKARLIELILRIVPISYLVNLRNVQLYGIIII